MLYKLDYLSPFFTKPYVNYSYMILIFNFRIKAKRTS